MFHSVRENWLSASKHNMADVKELIPEFFYLPDLLLNKNNFDLGKGKGWNSIRLGRFVWLGGGGGGVWRGTNQIHMHAQMCMQNNTVQLYSEQHDTQL